jgi:hypothetical protein
VGSASPSSSFPRKRESSSSPVTTSAGWIPDQVRNDGEWRHALAAYEAVEAELRAFERRTAGAAWEEQEAVERGMDARLDALRPALLRLVGTPAPDLPAVAAKIALIEAHEVGTLDGGEGCLAVLKFDVLRLARP